MVTLAYKQQSLEILKHTFQRISVEAIRQVFEHSRHSFTDAYHLLSSMNDYIEEDDFQQQITAILELAPFLQHCKKIILKADRKIHARHAPNEPNLLEELDAIPEMNTKENRPVEVERYNRDEDDNTKRALEPQYVCACCFSDDIFFQDMCQCDEGHLVCTDCLRHYVEEQLDGKGVGEFQCMNMEAVPKCTAAYSMTQLGRAFPPSRLDQIEEKIFRLNFDKACMHDGCQCSKCNHLFVVAATNDEEVTDVSCPQCNHHFCRLCNESPHKSQTCDEAKAEKEKLNAHAATAEAMVNAVVRKCPRCKRPFLKEGNQQCNKIKCPCGAMSCYLCQQEIQGYVHFCQTPFCKHESCGKCVLFTNAEEDDRKARRQVAQTALRSAQRNDGAAAASLIEKLLSPPRKEQAPRTKMRRRPRGRVPQDNGREQQPRNVEPAARHANLCQAEENRRPLGRLPQDNGQEPQRRNVEPAARHANLRQAEQNIRLRAQRRGDEPLPDEPEQHQHAPEQNGDEVGSLCVVS